MLVNFYMGCHSNSNVHIRFDKKIKWSKILIITLIGCLLPLLGII